MPTTTQEKAQEILGKDFSPVGDALRLFPALEYSKEHEMKMTTVPFSADFLKSRKGSLVIVPGFNRIDDDVFSLRTLDGMFFERSMPRISRHNKSMPHISRHNDHIKSKPNFSEQTWNQSWSGTEDFFSSTAELRWYAISKYPKAPYQHVDISRQDDVMEPGRRRENAFVYTWAAWLHLLRTGEPLWPNVSVWTSDTLTDGRRVAVGGWEDSHKPIWVLEPSDSSINRFPKTVPSYEPGMF